MDKYNLIINTRCNKNCEYCFVKKDGKDYNVLSHLEKINSNVNILGGEPLIHSDINNIIKKCDELSIKYNIMTNLQSNLDDVDISYNCTIGASLGHIGNDDEYNTFISNFKKLNVKNFGVGFVLSKDDRIISSHSKYLRAFYNDSMNLLLNNFNICATLAHPGEDFIESDEAFEEYLVDSYKYIEDLKNIISITREVRPQTSLILGCGGLYRCMFKNSEDYAFIKNNINRFKYGCPKDGDYPFFVQDDMCYMCPSAKKLWQEKVDDLKTNYENGLKIKKLYIDKAPARCKSCSEYNDKCFGPCLGFYKKIN